MYSYLINEEIVRWAFEVFLKNKNVNGWWVAFTNPTAGPWKKIEAPDNDGKFTEIYRFAREEDRPDFVLVSDLLKIILIIEAKDAASKLIAGKQMHKSTQVMVDMGNKLRNIELDIWQKRKDYELLAGFLWHTESIASACSEALRVTEHFTEVYGSQQERECELPLNAVMLNEAKGLEFSFFRGSSRIDKDFFRYSDFE